jgi:hypothetical protein
MEEEDEAHTYGKSFQTCILGMGRSAIHAMIECSGIHTKMKWILE